jgi:excisionase family DNA binding protein
MSDAYHPDAFLPAGPDGPLLLPNPVARLVWPAVKQYLEDLRDRGAIDTLRAAAPALNRWEQLVLHADGFPRETVGGNSGDGTSSSSHEWISTDEAAERLGVSPQWVRALARRGDLQSRTVGSVRQVTRQAVEEHKRRRAG